MYIVGVSGIVKKNLKTLNILFFLPKERFKSVLKVFIFPIPNFPALQKLFHFLFQDIMLYQTVNYEAVHDYFKLQ